MEKQITIFSQRNELWNGTLREFRQVLSRTLTPRIWTITVIGNQIHTSWGQLGGAIQKAVEYMEGVNIGKKNEMTPEAYALDRAKEMCRKKHWDGYREFQNENFLDPIINSFSFENLPLNLCFYKPDNSMGPGMVKKTEMGKTLFTRKRNGLAFIIARGFEGCRLYSRKMLQSHDNEENTGLTWNDRFPHLIDQANLCLPNNSIILGELVMNRDGLDDFKHVQSLTKSLTQKSIQDQLEKGFPSFYVWDVAFFNGEDLVSNVPTRHRYELIQSFCVGHLLPIEIVSNFQTLEDANNFSLKNGWEGFVVVDPEGIYGDKAYNFRGRPDRPGKFCAKLKPELEDDFIVYWNPQEGLGEVSTKGRYKKGIKSVALYQLNKNGELVYISNCSSGLTDQMKIDLANPTLFPQVWKVLYTGRRYISLGDSTNALDFPRFSAVRGKPINECVNHRL